MFMETNGNGKYLYTTHQVAKMLGVTPITVIRWIGGGKMSCFTTLGGHRRIEHDELFRFTQSHNMPWLSDGTPHPSGFLVLVIDPASEMADHFEDMGKFIPDLQPVFVNNVFQAGAEMAVRRPDLIWINFHNADFDSFTFLNFMREDVRFRDVPILAALNRDDKMLIEKIRQHGIKEQMVHPFTTALLIRQIEILRSPSPRSKAA